MKKMLFYLASAVLLAGAVSCTPSGLQEEKDNPYKALSLTTKQSTYVDSGNSFSFNLLKEVEAASGKDYVISPLSLQFLLGMILDGAKGATADEICNVLGYGSGETGQVNEYCLSMLKQLPELDKQTKLHIANAIYVDDGWPLLDTYKSDVAKYYEAAVANLDFSKTKESAATINKWCSDNTEGLIKKVLEETSPDMLAYLLNALYFKSQWSCKFDKNLTGEEDFYNADGSKAGRVKMMRTERTMDYKSAKSFRAVRLPYGNGAYSMTVLLPKDGFGASAITEELASTDWNVLNNSFYGCMVDLWLPKFETTFKIKLNDILSQMGMPSAFNGKTADFSAMSAFALCLSFVNQDAVIKVDEEGTEAAAISSAGMMKNTAVGPPEETIVFHADRPFIYLITEKSTGAVLFAGRYSGK
ncbi:MAG: serpin family protein [Bacteroidales bacterium]|nr:serpin family protein [Bacteroidales bacterium]